MRKYTAFECYKTFKEGMKDMKNNGRSGRPKAHRTCVNEENVRELMSFNR